MFRHVNEHDWPIMSGHVLIITRGRDIPGHLLEAIVAGSLSITGIRLLDLMHRLVPVESTRRFATRHLLYIATNTDFTCHWLYPLKRVGRL